MRWSRARSTTTSTTNCTAGPAADRKRLAGQPIPAKAIEGTAYSDVNAMLVNPGRSIYTANQEGQTLPVGEPEKAVIRGEL